ncbi:MAG: pyrophosphate--fructose 6-phosphate 1-phosphotransferase [Candidatus Xenobia bacterium]
MRVPELAELQIKTLGPAPYSSSISRAGRFVDESSRVLLLSDSAQVQAWQADGRPLPSLERAGPRANLFFEPSQTVCGIVTCGGLCPGLNDVIRSLALNLLEMYGVKRVLGFRYGYKGLSRQGPEPVVLDRDHVDRLAGTAGSFLGSSRGPQDVGEMVDTLVRRGVDVLFVIGGDGTLRGASALAAEVARRGEPIAIIGVPKTIDNDIAWTSMSFGFHTSVEEARKVVLAAHAEARSAENGIGLVKLMGRHSGFIAAHATVASGVANFCLIPEHPLQLDRFLASLEQRLRGHGHAVIVVAEGAGQELMESAGAKDASGNVRLQDVGLWLKERISAHLAGRGMEFTLKYLDPSYSIRSAPANTVDSEYCLLLGHFAAHAGLAGMTDMTVGLWHQHFVHLPISVVTETRKQVDLEDEMWQSVLTMTGQARSEVYSTT